MIFINIINYIFINIINIKINNYLFINIINNKHKIKFNKKN